MSEKTLHPGEPAMSEARVRALLYEQFPEWADLPLTRCELAGTTHWVYRLGDEHCVRLPRVAYGEAAIQKTWRWLPILANHLSLSIPEPRALGTPTEEYPYHWAVTSWLDGHVIPAGCLDEDGSRRAARSLASLLQELQRVPTHGAPLSSRARGLYFKDAETRRAILSLEDRIDAGKALTIWDEGMRSESTRETSVWVHADLLPGNLLFDKSGELTAVLDFDGAGEGDLACDLMVAWSFLDEAGRGIFREALGARVSDEMWARGKAYALSQAVIFLPYYEGKHAAGEQVAWRQLRELLGEDAVR